MSAALAARIAIVREVATRPDALARAIEAAQIVASLTQDEPLAAGVLAHEALEPEQLENAGLARALGAETLRAAHELARFGEFGGSEQWSSTRSLSPVQAETLRKMVLGIVSDPRLVVARIAIQLARLQAAKSASTEVRAALATEARAVFAPLANRPVSYTHLDVYKRQSRHGSRARGASCERSTSMNRPKPRAAAA